MKYGIACLLLVGSTLVPHWHLTFLHGDFCFALTWAVIRCRKQRKLSENQFAECKEYKPTLAYKCECRQKSLTLPNVGNICIHWILWVWTNNTQIHKLATQLCLSQPCQNIEVEISWSQIGQKTTPLYTPGQKCFSNCGFLGPSNHRKVGLKIVRIVVIPSFIF